MPDFTPPQRLCRTPTVREGAGTQPPSLTVGVRHTGQLPLWLMVAVEPQGQPLPATRTDPAGGAMAPT
jgi:hypothetical protein